MDGKAPDNSVLLAPLTFFIFHNSLLKPYIYQLADLVEYQYSLLHVVITVHDSIMDFIGQ